MDSSPVVLLSNPLWLHFLSSFKILYLFYSVNTVTGVCYCIYQNAGIRNNIKRDNKSFETVKQFKYLGKTLTNKNSIHEEIKSRLKSGTTCYHSVQNPLSCSLLSKSVKLKIYRTIILPVVLYGCETWPLTLREECRRGFSRIKC
jgi:hypothetical protein